jgi:hypothetical protein
VIREKLAELYESEQQWSKAAQMLSGIDLDSGIKYKLTFILTLSIYVNVILHADVVILAFF